MEKKNKTFGDLMIGDYVYKIIGLWVYDLKIVKIESDPREQSIFLYYDPIKGHNEDKLIVWRKFSSSYNSTIFTEKKDAWERLIRDSQVRYRELANEIDERITEFDKLEKFLSDVKGEKLW